MKQVFAIVLLFCVLLVTGCGPTQKYHIETSALSDKSNTEQTIENFTKHFVYISSPYYQVVSKDWLLNCEDDFQKELYHTGVSDGGIRFNCVSFTEFFMGWSNALLYKDLWNSNSPAWKPAIFEVWYVQDNGLGHSIILAITDKGPCFFEPQTGKEITLTANELSNIALING
jgi:hypothetical protein